MNFKNLELPYLFNNRFELIELLGVGGMGFVFMAQDKTLKKEIAIKILNSKTLDSQLVRFQQEAKAIAKLHHPNILEVYDFASSSEGHYYLAIELVKGESLEDYLEQNETFSVGDFLDIGVKLLRGLEHAHSLGVLHRDIKPSNVMLIKDEDNTYQVKLVDFGLAKVSLEEKGLTATGVVVGSPLYMSPEQGSGIEVDERSDIYSFGCLMFKGLTGQVPFQGDDVLSTITMRQFEQAPKLSNVRDDLDFSQELETIAEKCLATEPGDRFQSVADLRSALEKELAKLRGLIETDENKQSIVLEEKSQSPLTSALMIMFIVVIFFGLVLFPLISKMIEPPVENLKAKTEPKEYFFNVPSEAEDTKIQANQIKLKTVKFIRNGRPFIGGEIYVESESLSTEAYKRIVDKSNQMPVYKVSLKSCSVDDEAMKYIAQIKGLEELRLTANEGISAESFKLLKSLTGLKRLYIDRMNISDDHLEALGQVRGLMVLDISRNPKLTSAVFSITEKFPDLYSLTLGSRELSLKSVVDFANSNKRLRHIGLRIFPENDSGADRLALIKYIHRLDLTNCKFTNPKKVIDYIARSKCIKHLELNNTGVKGRDVLSLNNNPNLKNLCLDKCSLNDKDLIELAKLKYIAQLSIKFNFDITMNGVKKLAQCKNLTTLHVDSNETIKHQKYTRKMLDQLN